MKIAMLVLIAATVAVAQDRSSAKKAAPPPKPAATQAAAQVTIPAGATQVESNLYRFTDAKGKTWLYRVTPFGIMKSEDKPAPAPTVASSDLVVVTDLGDSVQFEQKTPFGASKWVRKKIDLNENEKAILAREEAKRQASESPRNDTTSKADNGAEKR